MNGKEKRKVIEDYMEKQGLLSPIYELFETDVVKNKVKESYDAITSRCNELISLAPKEVENNANTLKENMQKFTFEMFLDDVRTNFLCVQYNSLRPLLETFFGKTLLKNISEKFTSENEAALRDVDESLDFVTDMMVNETLNIIYSGYVPAGIPEEVAMFLKDIAGGGPIIPAQALFGSDIDENESKTSDADKSSSEETE